MELQTEFASEIKPFSSMQSGGTGFLMTDSSKGMEITFLPHVGNSYKWAQSGITPEVGRYYHVVGVWNKEKGKCESDCTAVCSTRYI